MDVQGTPSDMMNNLPPHIIPTILTLMPLRDAFRTCILSHKWRDHCLEIPKLKFDDAVFEGSAYKNLSIKCKLLHIVYPILLLHQGPILEFSLCMSQLTSCCEIDQIIHHLSRNDSLKFTLWVKVDHDHKLRPSFFNLQNLTALDLQNCVFQPPVTFKGFGKLVCLSFKNVSITSKVLLPFISGCPLLKDFTLIGDEKHLLGCWNSDFDELFKCLPLVEHLRMSSYAFKCFATGAMPQKLPNSLVHLKHLHLQGVCFALEFELLSVLLMVTSSPNIETIILEMQHNPAEAVPATVRNLVDQRDYSHVIWGHLRGLVIRNFTHMKPGMDFVKLTLAKSAMLKKVDIMIDQRVDVNGEVKMLKELVHYPRASPRAEIRFERS